MQLLLYFWVLYSDTKLCWEIEKKLGLHLHVRYLADAIIQSDLQTCFEVSIKIHYDTGSLSQELSTISLKNPAGELESYEKHTSYFWGTIKKSAMKMLLL